MIVYGFEEAKRQAQANANLTKERWVLWGYPAGGWWIERDWPTRQVEAVEVFDPE